MSQFGGVNETLALAVERLERLHEVGERSALGVCADLFVDGQDLLELILLLACVQIAKCAVIHLYSPVDAGCLFSTLSTYRTGILFVPLWS